MSDYDRYIPGVPCWVDTSQPDPEPAVEFYSGLFGWEFADVMPPGSPGKYFIARIGDADVAAVGSVPEGAPEMAMWNTYIWVESADGAAAKAIEAGGSVLTEPFDVMESGRMAVLADRGGATFCAWQAKEHRGAQLVNEHGTLNFNGLNTREPEGAKEFYGALFGWEILELSGGAQMWSLPGYGEHLDLVRPGTTEGMAEMGAPAGFENVVADLQRIGDDQPDMPAHWGVTFAVDDADAIAARAAELGGRLAAEPFDAPWTRMCVITDPQGAAFVASQFVPENKDLATSPDAAIGAP